MRWRAVWSRDRGHENWELLVTDDAGNVAMREVTTTPAWSPQPRDGFLVALGLCPAGDWERGEDGTLSCPVITTSRERELALIEGLLARGRSDPRGKVPADESPLTPRMDGITTGQP